MLLTRNGPLPARQQQQQQRQRQQQYHHNHTFRGRFRPLRKPVAVAGVPQSSLNGTSSSHGTSSSGSNGRGSSSTTIASTRQRESSEQQQKRAVVVGGGWAGFGAALALAKAGASVTLLDASPNPGGLSSAFKTSGGRQMCEPGIKGFWYQYANIEALVAELGIPTSFTPFTRSSFWSPQGLQVESPIFQDLPRLPAPLGSFVHTALLFRSLPLPDRATAVSLLTPLLEHDLDEELYRHYDSMSAFELFQSAGVSRQLYDQFLAPMLLVTLFAPPTELSAAAALGALYYFALAHTPDFDVRWARGPIGELIFAPLAKRLQSLGVTIVGGRRVDQLLPAGSSGTKGSVTVVARGDGQQESFDADVVVLAAGIPALQQLVLKSPLLAAAPDLRAVMGVRCSDVLAVRLWLNERLQLRTPSNVVAGFDAGVGGTFFQLEVLQDMYKDAPGSVLEFDLYHAEPLLPLSDEEIIQRLLRVYLPPALGESAEITAGLKVLDSSVLRFRNAVTQFSPGSNDALPGIRTSLGNVFVAGDCVKQGPGTHGCKGLSQEKAYVSGLQAGNSAASRLGLAPAARVIPVEPDEPHITAAKDLLRTQRALQQLLGSGLWPAGSSAAAATGSRAPQVAQAPQDRSQDRSQEIVEQVEDLRRVLRSEVQASVVQAAGAGGGGPQE